MNTLFDKIWDAHVVQHVDGGPDQLYIDRLYCHEVTSPQAFDGLRARGLRCLRPEKIFCMPDHNTPTEHQDRPIEDPVSKKQVDALVANAAEFGLTHYGMNEPDNGIIHVVGPEKALSLPGMTIVCGDSHTSTHGAVGAVAFGIGTSEVEMVMASQCILQQKPKSMRIRIEGELGKGVTAKDVALFLMSRLTTSGATGYFVDAPKGEAWEQAVERWKQLRSDDDAVFDREVVYDAAEIPPMITYGTNPGMGTAVCGHVPTLDEIPVEGQPSFCKALKYMDFQPGDALVGKSVDYVFLGACTNGRIEDFRAFASIVKGRKKAPGVVAWLVPGSQAVRRQIEAEGLDLVLREAGFEIRQPGCSACLAMNPDKVPAGKYCVSTSNRNFEGRQGPGSRTLLASPLTAAAAAVTGVITDPRDFLV